MDNYGYVTIEAFGHVFEDIPSDEAEDLRTLQREGAIYAEFGDVDAEGEFLGTFTKYRIPFEPYEIFEYIEATLAEREFNKASQGGAGFQEALLAISVPKYRERVFNYGEYGGQPFSPDRADARGCPASFLGEHLELLVCGNRLDRYEAMPQLGSRANRDGLVLGALKSVAVSARKLANRAHGRPSLVVENEYDVQDLTETALRSIFVDVVREEWTPKSAGGAKRIDLAIRSIGAVIECKYVRDGRHSRHVADELRVDFESYHEYAGCRQLYALVFDPCRHIFDPAQFCHDLDGLRRKRDHEFSVSVTVVQ